MRALKPSGKAIYGMFGMLFIYAIVNTLLLPFALWKLVEIGVYVYRCLTKGG